MPESAARRNPRSEHGVATPVEAWEALFRSQVLVLRRLQRDFDDSLLSLNEYDVLFNLSRVGDRALLRDLTAQLLISQPSVSRLVDRMVERGLLEKCLNEHDRRGLVITVTDRGREAYRRVAVRHAHSITEVVGGALSPTELGLLRRLTLRLQRAALAPDEGAENGAVPTPGGIGTASARPEGLEPPTLRSEV